ncbi:uncharacterized protein Nmag_0051 [Natrialba magadii ATCC 43099]|uniref:DUF11 domain-containing protein n=1 Tax=Natrialba magadii (strain ATCC 43099 / DSM 3394 / CCM 3739 / CIP 104546 / IAM 13178 / JCM 8861 / NBRC 102185 / NCIMB 2190 / MS3) TaxID=547559 RepID=D3SVT1_NATMM|nr:hypothetical protein [Natrialba magadii]ADD03650.1 uncharacterized protein Nmag_0051 [Natrialba magadii ATCC 43099]ELY34416.1 hypothetical protein C500_00737 [Natrialba magadii ATCC 43099]
MSLRLISALQTAYSKITEFIEEHGFVAGLLTGILLTFVITPLLTPIFVPIGDAVGVYNSPVIEIEHEVGDPDYREGDEIELLDNLSWESSYVTYQVQFTNKGDATAENIEAEVHLPGCLVKNSELGTSEGVSVRDPILPREEEIKENGDSREYCSQTVNIGELDPGTDATVAFVVDTDVLSEDTRYYGLNTNLPVKTDYMWESQGVYLEDSTIQQSEEYEVKEDIIENAGDNYDEYIYALYYFEDLTWCAYQPRENVHEDAEGFLISEEDNGEPGDPCPILDEHSPAYND